MKKRLLSAALALVMVLTMLPLSAFAVEGENQIDVDVTQEDPDTIIEEGKKEEEGGETQANTTGNEGITTTAEGGGEETPAAPVVSGKPDPSASPAPTPSFKPMTDQNPTIENNGLGSGKQSVQYYDYGSLDENKGIYQTGYYWTETKSVSGQTTYHRVSSGVVGAASSSGNSENPSSSGGTWYTSITQANANHTAFTLISGDSITKVDRNYVIDLNGQVLTISGGSGDTVDGKVSSLTFTDNQYIRNYGTVTGTEPGTVSGSIVRNNNPTGTGSNSNLIVNLNGVKVSGDITLTDYAIHTVNVTNGAEVKNITLKGTKPSTTTDQSQSLTVGSQTSARACTVGDIEIEGDRSQVNIHSLSASGSHTLKLTGQNTQLNINSGKLGKVEICGIPSTVTKTESTAPKIAINGGEVHSLEQVSGDKLTKELDITIGSLGKVQSNGVTIRNAAKITVNQGTIGGAVTLPTGSLTVNGPSASVASGGTITLNSGNNTTFKVTGKNNKLGDLKATNGSTLTIDIPSGRSNHFGTLSLGDYKGRGIKGGVFKYEIDKSATSSDGSTINETLWFDSDVSYVLKGEGTTYDVAGAGECAYYAHKELAQAVADAKGHAAGKTDGDTVATPLRIAGQKNKKGSTWNRIDFYNGDDLWARIRYSDQTGVYLPEKIMGISSADGGVDNWINLDTGTTYKSGLTFTTPLNTKGEVVDVNLGTQVSSSTISRLTSVNASSTVTGNKNVRAVLNGSKIELSGAVTADSGPWAHFQLTLNTNIVDSANKLGTDPYVVITRGVAYNVKTKEIQFDDIKDGLPDGVTMPNLTTLRLSNGTEYTLDGSGLKERADNFKVDDNVNQYGKRIEVSVNIPGLTNATEIQTIVDALSGTGSVFDWTTSPALRQAVNAAEMGLSDSTIKNWISTTQTTAYRSVCSTGTIDETKKASTGYNEVWLVPFLKMNVTAYHAATGSLTATLVPSYRVEVRQSNPSNAATAVYRRAFSKTDGVNIVQTERTLGELTGAMAHSPKTPAFKDDLGAYIRFATATTAFNGQIMHQDTTYAYQVANAGGGGWYITHAGKTGLGAILIDGTAPAITLYDKKGSGNKAIGYYDSLQAAVDDTTEQAAGSENYIEIGSTYTLNETITVTGDARKVIIKSAGNTELNINSSGGTVDWSKSGNEYTVQLLRSNTAATTSGIPITVTPVTGGSASVSPNNGVKVGDTLTITLNPAVGYAAGGVTVRTSDGATVNVSGSGTRYTFVVPTGAKGITVTPSFNRTAAATTTGATVSVSNSTSGTAVTSAGSNRVAGGSTVTVNTTPAAGQRTMGVYVSSDNGTATAIRTGLNSFSFTVPANATNVVVTPRFDANNGTLFEDVWSTEYYSAPVAWAVSQGVTTGTSTYTFGSNNVCTRADMVTFLWRAAGKPAVTGVSNPFRDVEAGTYYYDAVLWAVSKGITKGVETNRFGVNEYVTRAQAVTFLHRYEGTPGASGTSSFYDVPSSEYYARAVAWANGKGVTKGTSSTLFSPNSYCKRCEVVTFLYRDVTGNVA